MENLLEPTNHDEYDIVPYLSKMFSMFVTNPKLFSTRPYRQAILLRAGPQPSFTAYKLVTIDRQGDFVSMWDGSVYRLGETRTELALPDHGGGYYVYQNLDRLVEAWRGGFLVSGQGDYFVIAMLECECAGPILEYDNGKIAVTHCRPTRLIGKWHKRRVDDDISRMWVDESKSWVEIDTEDIVESVSQGEKEAV